MLPVQRCTTIVLGHMPSCLKTVTPHRCASNLTRKLRKQEEVKNIVYQYAGKNTKRGDRVYVWGYAATGALGVRKFLRPEKNGQPRLKQLQPHRLDFFDYIKVKAHAASCGYGYSVYLCHADDTKSQFVYATGINSDSQIGYHESPPRSGRILDYVIEPVQVALPLLRPDTTKLLEVACGRAHTLIKTDGEGIFSLGNNSYGQCGRNIVDGEIFKGNHHVHKVTLEGPVQSMVCGQDHSLFLMDDGSLYSCGLGADGQTGLGHYDTRGVPQKVKGDIDGERIISVGSKADTVLAASDNGDLFGWGNCEYGQFTSRDQDTTQLSIPRRLPFDNIGKVKKVAAGASMCAVLNDKGEVYVWGFGLLGKGPKLDTSSTPTMIPEPLFGRNEFNPEVKVVDIQCGLHHFCAITNHGDLYVWGRNKSACLGLGHKLDQFFPIKVQVPAEVRHITCGVDHTVVLCKTFV